MHRDPAATGLIGVSLDQASNERRPTSWTSNAALWVGGLALAVAFVGIARLILFGWATVAPDDARYIFVGLSTLAGDGPVTPDGNLFLLRSPAYGLALASAGQLVGDPLTGARLLATALAIAGLLGAVRIGWLIGGPVAGVCTAICLIAMPLIWRLLPTMRIDLPQTAGVVGVLLAIHRPTTRRWALAGVILGLTILVKETILLLGALPIAAVGFVPPRHLARLWLVYALAAVAVAAWWWVIVWMQAGVIFPLNALGTIERRDVGSDIRIDPTGVLILAAATASWLVVAWRARRELPARYLAVAAVCLAVPAAYATLNGLSTRNYVGLAVLTAIAIGVGVSTLGTALATRAGADRRRGVAVWGVIGVVLVAGALLGQRSSGRPSEQPLPYQIANWLEPRAGDRVVMTFLYSEVTAVDMFDTASIPKLPVFRYQERKGLDDYLWLGLRDQQLFGITRQAWAESLGDPSTSHLVLAGPHMLTPVELIPALDRGILPGVGAMTRIEARKEWAQIYEVEPRNAATPPDLSVHLSPATAEAWLATEARGSTRETREAQLIDARPILVGRGAPAFLKQLSVAACLEPAGEGRSAVRLVPGSPSSASGESCT